MLFAPKNRKIYNPILKEAVEFVRTASETNGVLSELILTVAPGGGPPSHYHTSYTEKFTALDGTLALELEGKQLVHLKPGESYLVKRGEIHRFFNPGEVEIRVRNEVVPGHAGFENTLRILAGLASDGQYGDKGVPRKFTHLAICGIMSDMRLPGIMRLLMPIMRLAAYQGRRKGIEQALMDKYCA